MSTLAAHRPEAGTHSQAVVEEQLAEAVSRIRVHDLVKGVLLVATWTAAYAVIMVVADKFWVLPDWLRQIGWGVFVLGFGGLIWGGLIRPLRSRINPLYAAAQVEKTMEDPKNLLTGYVDVRERGQSPKAIQVALSVRAAQIARAADVNRAVDHRSLLYLGLIFGILVVILTVLFFSWRATQFSSLVRRAFLPFTPQQIATRTQITLLHPEEGDTTITQGQTFSVQVHLGGRIPSAEAEDRPRLLLRHSLQQEEYEEIPLQPGETARLWNGKAPDYLTQVGFWYKIAAGDAETPEYRVTVRTLPLFTDFEVQYEYPAYMNRPADRVSGPYLRTYRGTRITLQAKTNREPIRGSLQFEAKHLDPVEGQKVPGLPDSLRFAFTAREGSRYRLRMDTSAGETNIDSPWYLLTLDPDLPPVVRITQPTDAEVTLPANGTLMVDGQVGDDFGVDKVRLRLRLQGRDLQPIPYMEGRSFRRERDHTWPTYLSYKLSADLTRLRFADNAPFTPHEGMILEYWVEAIDNCSEAAPVKDWNDQPGNVGRSEVRRLRLSAPLTQPHEQQQQEQQRQARQQEEQRHDQQQQQRLDTEDRTPQQQGQAQPQPNKGQAQSQPKEAQPQPKEGQPQPKEGQAGPANTQQAKGGQQPPPDTSSGTPQGGSPDQAPMPKTPEQRQLEEQARRVREELERQKQEWERQRTEGGTAKPSPSASEQPRSEAGQPKPPPQSSGMQDSMAPQVSQPKPAPDDTGQPPAESRPLPQNQVQGDPQKGPSAVPPGEERPSPTRQPQETASAPKTDHPNQNPAADKTPKGTAAQKSDSDSPKTGSSSSGELANKEPTSPDKLPRGDGNDTNPSSPMPSQTKSADTSTPTSGVQATEKKEKTPGQSKGELTAEQRRELEQAVEDLASGDPQKQQAARDKLDKTLGQQARQAIEKELQQRQAEWEQLQKDLTSADPQRRAAAQKRLEDLRREAQQYQKDGQAGRPKDLTAKDSQTKPSQKNTDSTPGANKPTPKLTPEELKALAEKAQDLTSPDANRRRQAEQALDEKLGRPAREQLQKQLQQLQKTQPTDDPQNQQQLQKELQQRLEELAQQQERTDTPPAQPGITRGRIDLDKYLPRGGVNADPPAAELEADPRHQARSAALQLEEFERHRSNEELLRRLGWTPEEYERFLEAQRQYVEQLQRQAQAYEERQPKPPPSSPSGAPTIRAGGAGKVESRPGASGGLGGVGGAPVAPPGFERAGERFFEELRKRQKK